MKLLFDENLSPRLPGLLVDLFPGSVHVRDCGLLGQSDERVWQYARSGGLTIVSKDLDFQQRSLLHGHPPKVIWLRVGNCNRQRLVHLLSSHVEDIRKMHAEPEESLLVLW